MSSILTILTKKIDTEIRAQMFSRVETMIRQLKYLRETENSSLLSILSKGWTLERLEIICELNSFYQILLAPLASSARERTGAFGDDTVILYGTLRFGKERAAKIRAAYRSFFNSVNKVGVTDRLLTANQASDIVYYLNYKMGE